MKVLALIIFFQMLVIVFGKSIKKVNFFSYLLVAFLTLALVLVVAFSLNTWDPPTF